MIDVTNIRRPARDPATVIREGMNAFRQLRIQAENNCLTPFDTDRLVAKVEAGFVEAMRVMASAPPPSQPFRVIDGGLS